MTTQYNRDMGDMLKNIRENGGFTYRPTSGFHSIGKPGYSVSIEGHEKAFSDKKFTTTDLMDYWFSKRAMVRDNPKLHIGAWHDTENGLIVLDLSEVFQDRGQAIRVGKQRKQAAIFDLGQGDEIRLDADEGRLAGVAGKD